MAITSTSGKTVSVAAPASSYTGAMAMVTTLFFMWGFITCLNDILIPHLKSIFDLNYAQAMLVQFAFFSGYFLFALPSGKIIEKIGYKRSMVAGLMTIALGAILFLPAASLASFPFFLTALMIVAAGITLLQVSANPYVSVLGPPQTASSRLNLTQAFNSLGTTVAPYFGSLLILSNTTLAAEEVRKLSPAALQAYRMQEASTVKFPYLLITLTLAVLAVIISFYKLPVISNVETTDDLYDPTGRTARSIWRQRHLVLGVIGIFVYVGAEVSIGSFLINYFAQPEIGGMTEKVAALYVPYYWGGAMVGRFIGSAALQKLRTGMLLGIAAIAACLLVVVSMLSFGSLAMWSIILVGFFNSIMFPSIFTLGIAELGPLTSKGSGLLVMAIVGGAIIPYVQGLMADKIGIHHAFLLPVLCYLYIAFYGFRGSKPAVSAAA
jgi:MFS transporter, FHS family, L-fucose permease